MDSEPRTTHSLRHRHWLHSHLWLFLGIFLGISITLCLVLTVIAWLSPRALPGISVVGHYVGGQTHDTITKQVSSAVSPYHQLHLTYQDQQWTLNLDQINWQPDPQTTAQRAISWGKNWQQLGHTFQNLNQGVSIPLEYSYDPTLLQSQIASIAAQLETPVVDPQITITPQNQVSLTTGSPGRQLDTPDLLAQIDQSLATLSLNPILMRVVVLDPTISQSDADQLKTQATTLIDKQIIFTAPDQQLSWTDQQLVGFLPSFPLAPQNLAYQLNNLSQTLNRPAQNAILTFSDQSHRVTEFKPEVIGRQLNTESTSSDIKTSLDTLINSATTSATIALQFQPLHPEVAVSEINNLGIRELLGQGESQYRGSIPGRRHNVDLASKRVSGILIKPGDTVSFNQHLGDVSAATGFQQAYIIQSGKTILGDGGGVCQVSSTLFRAVLAAGLPITERHAHSYRVGYYEQNSKPGFDATVFSPSADFKFTNDTPAHILIQSVNDPATSRLTYQIYGTSDGRVATTTNSRVWGVTEPPPDIYQDDPTLPIGEVKQVEHKAWGAKAAFDWRVVRGDEVLQERTFFSNYRPWQAVFLKGTKT